MGDVPDFMKRHSTGDWSPRFKYAGPASAPFEWGGVDMTQLGRVKEGASDVRLFIAGADNVSSEKI